MFPILPGLLHLGLNIQFMFRHYLLVSRGKPLARPTLSSTGIVPIQGKTSNIEPYIVYVPPTHTNVVNPASSSGHPLGAQPVTSQTSRGYGYQIPVGNHPPNPTGMPYAGIPYPSNTFTPWGHVIPKSCHHHV